MEYDGIIRVTNGRSVIEAPFHRGETALAAMERAVKLRAPCRGNGTCGQCVIEVLRPDGTRARELACMYPARECTVFLRVLRPADDSVRVLPAEEEP